MINNTHAATSQHRYGRRSKIIHNAKALQTSIKFEDYTCRQSENRQRYRLIIAAEFKRHPSNPQV